MTSTTQLLGLSGAQMNHFQDAFKLSYHLNYCWKKVEGISELAADGKSGSSHLNFAKQNRFNDLLEICRYFRIDIESSMEDKAQLPKVAQGVDFKLQEILSEAVREKKFKDVDCIAIANRVWLIYCELDPQLGESFKKRFSWDNTEAITEIRRIFLMKTNAQKWSSLNILHILRNLAAFSLPYTLSMAAAENFFYSTHKPRIKEFCINIITSCGWSTPILNEEVSSRQNSYENEFWSRQFSCGFGLYAFGHMLNAYESLLSLVSIVPRAKGEVVISPSMVANSALGLLISKAAAAGSNISLRIGEAEYVKWRYIHNENQNFLEMSSVLYKLRVLRGQESAIGDYLRPLLQTHEIDWDELAMLTNTTLYNHPRPYVTLYMRDANFKKEGEGIGLNSDRNADPNRMREIACYIISKGYDVLRIGDEGMCSLELDNQGFFEYCRSPVKSDLNDLYVTDRAEFCVVGGLGGAATLGDIFGKKSIYIDFPLARRGYFNPLASIVPYRYYKSKSLISPEELFRLTPGGCFNAAALSQMDIHWQPYSVGHIKEKLETFMVYLSKRDSQRDTRLICRKLMGDSTILNTGVSNKVDMFPIYVL
jgi:putative glycosyltransferase (TIGR04372 family)